jgi:hypothetical protein
MTVRAFYCLGFAALLLGAPAVAQGLPTGSMDEIISATRSCLAATSSTGVDEQKLQADGWHRATLSANGKPVQNGMTFYGRNGLLLILNKSAPTPLCALTARIAAGPDFLKLQAAMAALYGGSVGTDPQGEYVFMAPDHHIIDLAPTGTSDRPAVRVAVGVVPQENK